MKDYIITILIVTIIASFLLLSVYLNTLGIPWITQTLNILFYSMMTVGTFMMVYSLVKTYPGHKESD